jgi:hypothetical protein
MISYWPKPNSTKDSILLVGPYSVVQLGIITFVVFRAHHPSLIMPYFQYISVFLMPIILRIIFFWILFVARGKLGVHNDSSVISTNVFSYSVIISTKVVKRLTYIHYFQPTIIVWNIKKRMISSCCLYICVPSYQLLNAWTDFYENQRRSCSISVNPKVVIHKYPSMCLGLSPYRS